jgi:hypothetical protein
VNPFSISRPRQPQFRRASFQRATLALVSFPTLGQKCDDLLLCAQPRLMAEQTELTSLGYPPEAERKDCSGVESSKR